MHGLFFTGYRTFCVFFNANEASVYRALLAFIFVAKILAGFPLFKQRGINYPPTFVGPLSLQKGAVWCAYLYLFISLLLNREINYKAVFLFSHYTLRMQKLIDRKNTDCFPLWRERGTIRQDGWWKVEPSMLERRNVDQCDWYIKSMEQHFLSYIPRFWCCWELQWEQDWS